MKSSAHVDPEPPANADQEVPVENPSDENPPVENGAEHPDQENHDAQQLENLAQAYRRLQRDLGSVVVGQGTVIEQLLIVLLSGGHGLLEGAPGLAKTLMVESLAKLLDLKYRRIQFTPDLMPADITGTEVIEENRTTGNREFRFVPGPIFANMILADEINRTPPKTQAALLEAMQEHQVTAGGHDHRLAEPFFVLATQNPIEQQGTYPLPEAQLDRFLLHIVVDYPDEEDEFNIVRQTTGQRRVQLEKILTGDDVIGYQQLVRRIPVADHVIRYAMSLARRTRDRPQQPAPPAIARYLRWGAGPRASQGLVLAGKARAALQGRGYVALDDIKAVAKPVLRHRLLTNFHAEADRVTADDLIDQLLELADQDQSNAPSEKGSSSGGSSFVAKLVRPRKSE